MNYEKKYNEALAKARTFYKKWDGVDAYNSSLAISELKEIFPELKESGEEKLRKEMLQIAKESEDSFYMVLTPKKKETLISLLEKQGQQKEINLDKILKHYPRETELYSPLYGKLWLAEVDENFGIITCYKHPLDEGCTRAILYQEDTVSFYANGTTGLPDFSVSDECMLFLYDSEKQGDQKPVDKVEPKFKVGKWYQCTKDFFGKGVTFDKNTAYYCAKEGCLQDEYGCHIAIVKDLYDNFKLWTIEDAKDGNVLYSPGHNLLWIYKNKNKNTYHVGANLNYPHHISVFYDIVIPSDVCPASKEQCDILFARLKKFGYTWDKDTKKPIKL